MFVRSLCLSCAKNCVNNSRVLFLIVCRFAQVPAGRVLDCVGPVCRCTDCHRNVGAHRGHVQNGAITIGKLITRSEVSGRRGGGKCSILCTVIVSECVALVLDCDERIDALIDRSVFVHDNFTIIPRALHKQIHTHTHAVHNFYVQHTIESACANTTPYPY